MHIGWIIEGGGGLSQRARRMGVGLSSSDTISSLMEPLVSASCTVAVPRLAYAGPGTDECLPARSWTQCLARAPQLEQRQWPRRSPSRRSFYYYRPSLRPYFFHRLLQASRTSARSASQRQPSKSTIRTRTQPGRRRKRSSPRSCSTASAKEVPAAVPGDAVGAALRQGRAIVRLTRFWWIHLRLLDGLATPVPGHQVPGQPASSWPPFPVARPQAEGAAASQAVQVEALAVDVTSPDGPDPVRQRAGARQLSESTRP